MSRLKYSVYEIVSVAVGVAIIAFFGTLIFLPFEIMMWGEGQTVYWLFIIMGLSVIFAFVLLSFVKRAYFRIILRIANVATVITAIIMVNAFLLFTHDLFEPWLIQVGWFIRYNGLVIGLFVGAVTIQTIIAMSQLIIKFNTPKNSGPSDLNNGSNFSKKLITFLIVSLGFSFYIIEMLIFRYWSLFLTLLTIFVVETTLIIYTLLTLLKSNYYNALFVKAPNPTAPLVREIENQPSDEIKKFLESETVNSKFKSISRKIREAGSDPSIFWYLFIPLLAVLVLSIATAILYPLNIVIDISFPFGENVIFYPLPLVQLFAFLIVLLLLFIVAFNAWGGRMNRRLGPHIESKKKRVLAVSTFGAIDIMRFLGIFLAFSQILYFFDYPLYLPSVVSYYLLFGVVGAGVYFFIARFPKLKKLVYALAILLLVLNFYLTYTDGIQNASNPYGGEFDIMFPFPYLHSLPNYVMVGIPVGFIISDLLFSLAFTHTTGIDAPNRAVCIGSTPFVMGMIFMLGNYVVGTPGGDPPPGGMDFLFYYFCLVLGAILFIGVVFNYLVTEVILPIFIQKRSKIKIKNSTTSSPTKLKPPTPSKMGVRPKRKVIALSLAGLMVLSFIGGISIYATYNQTYTRPIICSSSGNYYVWIQNSSERVTKNVLITETSPQIAAVPLNLAKNEYGAMQLVWHPFKPVQSLTYTFSDFYHQNGSYIIAAGNCTLRKVEFVMENEFPDVLVPFTTTDLSVKENNIFWFAIRTPYDAMEGIYDGNLTFSFTGGEEVIPFEINIWNFTIPHMRHLRTNIGGQSTDPERIETYIDHRINDYGVSIRRASSLSQLNTESSYTCYLDEGTDTWTFNWTWWDAQIQSKLDQGMNGFRLNYPLGIPRDPPIEDATWMLRIKNWLTDVEAHLDPIGWLNYSYFYFIDEFQMFVPEGYTLAEYLDRLEVLLQEMKNASSKIKIMTTAPPFEQLNEYVDIFCPISNDRDKQVWDELLAEDYEFWFYSCVGPMAPWPNAHLYNRLYEIRIEMWQVWLYDIHGFLFWTSTGYYHGHYGLAFNGYGDGWFIYDWNGTLHDSIRWENFLEGQEDYEYLWLLNATLQYLEDHPGLISTAELASYRAEFNNIIDGVVGERWIYCDHVASLYSGRDRIGTILDTLGGLVNLTSISEAIWLPPFRIGS